MRKPITIFDVIHQGCEELSDSYQVFSLRVYSTFWEVRESVEQSVCGVVKTLPCLTLSYQEPIVDGALTIQSQVSLESVWPLTSTNGGAVVLSSEPLRN